MQELHLVGITTDRQHLIFSIRRGAKSGSYLVAIGDELREVVDDLADERAEQRAAAAAAPPRPDAKLSVREMQARLRAGVSVAEVAGDAGVDEDWVERFAAPVRAEQQRIVALARDLPMVRARAGESAVPLGTAVARAMAERGVTFSDGAFDAAWSARMTRTGEWEIDFAYTHRSHDRTVTWVLDLDARQLTTSDRSASQIGFVAPDDEIDASPRRRPASTTAGRRSTPPGRSSARGPDHGATDRARERSTRGDGRPDSAPSTEDIQRARKAAGSQRPARPPETGTADSTSAAPEPSSRPAPAPMPGPAATLEPASPETDTAAVSRDEAVGPVAPAVRPGADTEAVPPPFVPAAAPSTVDADAVPDAVPDAPDETEPPGTGRIEAPVAPVAPVETTSGEASLEEPAADPDGEPVEASAEEPAEEPVDEPVAGPVDGTADPESADDAPDEAAAVDTDAGIDADTNADIDVDGDVTPDDDVPAVAFDFTGDADGEGEPDPETDEASGTDESASDRPETEGDRRARPPRRATVRFRSGAATRAADTEPRMRTSPDTAGAPSPSQPDVRSAPAEKPAPPGADSATSDASRFAMPDPWARRPVEGDDDRDPPDRDDAPDPGEVPTPPVPSDNGRTTRRRRTRQLRAR